MLHKQNPDPKNITRIHIKHILYYWYNIIQQTKKKRRKRTLKKKQRSPAMRVFFRRDQKGRRGSKGIWQLLKASFFLSFFQSPARAWKGKDYGLFLVKNTVIIIYLTLFKSKKRVIIYHCSGFGFNRDIPVSVMIVVAAKGKARQQRQCGHDVSFVEGNESF